MNNNIEWYNKMQELKASLEGSSDLLRDSEQWVHEWVKEYLNDTDMLSDDV